MKLLTIYSIAAIFATVSFLPAETPPPGDKPDKASCSAKEKGGPGYKKGKGEHKPFWERFQQKLNLTEDQVTEMQEIAADGKAAANLVHENKSLSKEEKKEQLREIWEDVKEETHQILTPEQKAKLEEMKQNKEKKSGGKKGSTPPASTSGSPEA